MSQAVEGDPAWLAALRTGREGKGAGAAGNRKQLQEQTVAFLRDLTSRRPLLLLLDDLHWVDADSVSLLFHLARRYRDAAADGGRLPPGRGRYRPGWQGASPETAAGRVQTSVGLTPINLNRLPEPERRDFVEHLVAARYHLDAEFRQALFERTEGHALFTVEMLRDLQARGDIVWQDRGLGAAASFDWDSMPSRAEGVIEARVARLAPELREMLAVASVEGELFSAQTLAAALDRRLDEVIGRLSTELDRQHRLVTEVGTTTVGGNKIDRFRFRHSLFRQHLYEDLGEAERRLRHGQVGAILERSMARRLPPSPRNWPCTLIWRMIRRGPFSIIYA